MSVATAADAAVIFWGSGVSFTIAKQKSSTHQMENFICTLYFEVYREFLCDKTKQKCGCFFFRCCCCRKFDFF